MSDAADLEVIIRTRTHRGELRAETVAGEVAAALAALPGGLDVTLVGANFPGTSGHGDEAIAKRLRGLRNLLNIRVTVVIDDESTG